MQIAVWMIVALAAAVIVVGGIIAMIAVSSKNEKVSAEGDQSYFDGSTWQLIGYRILSALVNTITLGIAYPWMLCMVQRWEVKHTVIHGRRLKFNGHGHQLIGKYLLWVFLTIITFGIYGIWLGLGMKKWVVKHTVYADEEQPDDSYFSGGAGGYLGTHILSFVLTLFTLGIGKAWADKMVLGWEARHTHIGGSPLQFNGTGGQLFVKYLLLALLTPLTLGIYALFFPVIYMKWQVKHTEAVYQTPEIQAKAKAHEMTAVQDFAKYRIAANDQEIAAMKSGFTGKEDNDTLERLAEEGNPFAAYHFARLLKGENALYEGRALELLQKAADGKVHSALLDLAKQMPSEKMVSMLTEAAQYGNAEASWLLVVEYRKNADLTKAAYWFKVALEWGVADAKARTNEYDDLVKKIALQLSENREMPKQSKVLPIVLGVVGVLMLAGIVFGVLLFRVVPSNSSRTVRIYTDSMAPTLESGDVIYLNDDIEDIEVGDIIAFIYDESGLIAAHRVVEVITDDDGGICYVTKGDNNIAPDANPVHPANIIGVYDRKAGFFGKIFGISSSNSSGGAQFHVPIEPMTERLELETSAPSDDDMAEVTSPTESTDTPSTSTTPEVNLASSIVGEWVCYDMLTNMTTGEDTLEVWDFTFNSDGTYGWVYEDCTVSTNGWMYYGGRYWETMFGYGEDGTYSVNGDKVTVQYYLDGENAVLSSRSYTVELHENSLSIYCDGWDRTRVFERK